MREVVVYRAKDGTTFESKERCIKYERASSACLRPVEDIIEAMQLGYKGIPKRSADFHEGFGYALRWALQIDLSSVARRYAEQS